MRACPSSLVLTSEVLQALVLVSKDNEEIAPPPQPIKTCIYSHDHVDTIENLHWWRGVAVLTFYMEPIWSMPFFIYCVVQNAAAC